MLTAAQCSTVAYMIDSGPICADCARAQTSEIAVSRADAGLGDDSIRPISQYDLGCYQTETAAAAASSIEDSGEYVVSDDYCAAVTCENCGEELLSEYGAVLEATPLLLIGRAYERLVPLLARIRRATDTRVTDADSVAQEHRLYRWDADTCAQVADDIERAQELLNDKEGE